MSRRKVFTLTFAIVFVLWAGAFWTSTEVALYAFMAAVTEGDRAAGGYLVGWAFGTSIPALAIAWIASLVLGAKQMNKTRDEELKNAVEQARKERLEREEKFQSAA